MSFTAHLVIVLMVAAALVAFAGAAPAPSVDVASPIKVPVATRYITTEVYTLKQDEPIIMIGHLCAAAKGMAVAVAVLLNNNPDWDPTYGVLRYYVVDDCSKGLSNALCTNAPKGVPGANCTVASWPSDNDICIKGQAGQSEAISFTVDVVITAKASREVAPSKPRKDPLFKELSGFSNGNVTTVYLSEVVSLSTSQELAYHGSALLKFTFCPTPQTGTRYAVQAATTDVDDRSSYAQYICDDLPCVVDGKNVIAHNGRQVPTNVVSTASGSWKTLYALIVCWGGVWDEAKHDYMGHFIFNAHQN